MILAIPNALKTNGAVVTLYNEKVWTSHSCGIVFIQIYLVFAALRLDVVPTFASWIRTLLHIYLLTKPARFTDVQITRSERINNFQASKLFQEILDQLIGSFSLTPPHYFVGYDEPSIHFSNIFVCLDLEHCEHFCSNCRQKILNKCKSQRCKRGWCWAFDSPSCNYKPNFVRFPRWCPTDRCCYSWGSALSDGFPMTGAKWHRFYP